MTGIHIRGGEDTQTQRYREEGRVTIEAGIEVKHIQAKNIMDCQEPARNRQRKILFWSLEREHGLVDTLIQNF